MVCPQNDEDWETLAKTLNSDKWTAADCREKALKMNWKPPKITESQSNEECQPDLKVVNGRVQNRSDEDFFANQTQEVRRIFYFSNFKIFKSSFDNRIF